MAAQLPAEVASKIPGIRASVLATQITRGLRGNPCHGWPPETIVGDIASFLACKGLSRNSHSSATQTSPAKIPGALARGHVDTWAPKCPRVCPSNSHRGRPADTRGQRQEARDQEIPEAFTQESLCEAQMRSFGSLKPRLMLVCSVSQFLADPTVQWRKTAVYRKQSFTDTIFPLK